MVIFAPHDQQESSLDPQKPSAKCVLGCMYLPLNQNHIYTNLPAYLFGVFFRLSEMLLLWL